MDDSGSVRDSDLFRTLCVSAVRANFFSLSHPTGTKELGKNIVVGVSGIVVSPLRGWEAGGGVGLGLGVARGKISLFVCPLILLYYLF